MAKKTPSSTSKSRLETTRPIGDQEPRVGENIERDWGNPNRSQPRELVARSERVIGIAWLSAGALISLVLEVLYLGVWMPVGDGQQLAFPITILFAAIFNVVLTRTALLWTQQLRYASIPLYVWFAGFVVISATQYLPGSQQSVLLLSSLRSMMLLIAGLGGGVWPLLRRFGQNL